MLGVSKEEGFGMRCCQTPRVEDSRHKAEKRLRAKRGDVTSRRDSHLVIVVMFCDDKSDEVKLEIMCKGRRRRRVMKKRRNVET